MEITCGKCGTTHETNKGRGLCSRCYGLEHRAGRHHDWHLDRSSLTGIRVRPRGQQLAMETAEATPEEAAPEPRRLGGDKAAIAQPPEVAAPRPEAQITVPFNGEDLKLYQRVVRRARVNRRSVEAELLCLIDQQYSPRTTAQLDWPYRNPPVGD